MTNRGGIHTIEHESGGAREAVNGELFRESLGATTSDYRRSIHMTFLNRPVDLACLDGGIAQA